MKMTRFLPALSALMFLAACATLGPTMFGPNALTPWKHDQVKFPHARHAQADVDCITCHEAAYDAKNLQARLLPLESKCMECHGEEKEKGNCRMCHADAAVAAAWPKRDPKLNFNHVNHIERTKEDCKKCHTALPEPTKTRQAVVTMDTCLKCHEHQEMYQAGRCDVCHRDLTAERMKPPTGFTHLGNWGVQHRVAARSNNDSCMVCHTQSQCVQCHNATVPIRPDIVNPDPMRQMNHRNDFVSRHNLEAQADPAQCYRCHGNNFCSDCHKLQNLTPAGSSPRSPHPRSFVQRGGPEFHGTEAQRDIQRCAACHDQGPATNCINCHKEGGVGGNPHPSNWGADHNRQDIRMNGMCQYCHR